MADIELKRVHGMSENEALTKLHALVADFSERYKSMAGTPTWTNPTTAVSTGAYFNAVFSVTDTEVFTSIELKDFAAKMAKGAVLIKAQQELDKFCRKG